MQFFGKYRGKVSAVKDPLHLGRIQVQVPAVFGDEKNSWAMPCTPYAGKDIGLFMVPPVGTNIWVEFEGGDPDYPIWSGCFWGDHELPQAARVPDPYQVQVFQTEGVTLTVSGADKGRGITLEVKKPMVEQTLKLIYNPDGIEINHDNKMTAKFLTGNQTIEVKNGDNTTVTLAKDVIQLKQTSIEAALTNNSIKLTCNPATITLSTSSGIEVANSSTNAKWEATGLKLSSGAAGVQLGPGGVDVKSGGLGSIKVSPASVSVNNGALEVT